jgi:CubicO group peptidase (beta-lactamase class C family)
MNRQSSSILLMILLATALPGGASTPTPMALTSPDVEAFLDGLVPLQLERHDIAGAVISIVRDGRVIFDKGYGYADTAAKVPPSPQQTLFRPGSISKLFTWTAVMQLVEHGQIDLDRDVNAYLDFKVPEKDAQPVTMRRLMTHTAGFEESIKDVFVGDPNQFQTLGAFLRSHIPRLIFTPGSIPAYSNYGAALAGYIIQRVSGQPLENYIAQNILEPLAMTHTTFAQPPPGVLKGMLSKGYQRASRGAKPFELIQLWPAGSLSTTAEDMSRFLIAHLQDGRYENARILRTETARLMHSRQFGLSPATNGMALGFYEEARNGYRIVGHAGDTALFHSDLHLIPEAGLGFFISFNSNGDDPMAAKAEIWDKFLDRYFPECSPALPTTSTAREDAQTVSGFYEWSRRAQTTLLSVGTLLGELRVFPNANGTISVDAWRDASGQYKRWREVGRLVYREVDGSRTIAFVHDVRGRLILAPEYPVFVAQRVSWLQSKTVDLSILAFGIGILVLMLLAWPITAIVRRHYGQTLSLAPRERALRRAVRMLAAVDVAFLAAWAAILLDAASPLSAFARFSKATGNLWMYILAAGGVAVVAGGVIASYYAARVWNATDRALWVKFGNSAVALGSLGLAWFIINWHLLSFHLNY